MKEAKPEEAVSEDGRKWAEFCCVRRSCKRRRK